MEKELREYQSNITDLVVNSDKDLIICLPTGSGKTVIASAIMEKLPGLKIFIVPRLELIQQAKDEFGDVDVIWADKTSITGKSIVIASKESLRRQWDRLKKSGFGDNTTVTIIFDEAHISIKQTKTITDMINPDRVLGLTATPERMDGYALLKGVDGIHRYGVFDEVLKAETVPSLIKKGFLCDLKYYARPIEGITEIKPDNSMGEELSDKQMQEIFTENHIWGDLVKCYEAYGKGRPAIGFTTTIAMAEKVVSVFNEEGYNFKVIHGGMSVKERQKLIDALKRRRIHGLVNADLLTYGFDCPEASYAFSCRHIKSRPLWFQIVGRILRICPKKENAIFIDHGDSISEFSEPDSALPIMDELIEWRADGETKEQKAARKKRMKRVRETMEIIQELDPLPSNMVEVTMENTYDRLIRIIMRLKKENAFLSKAKAQSEQREARKDKEINTLKKELAEADKPKVIDKQKTFEFCKNNYARHRSMFKNEPDKKRAHQLTRISLLKQKDKLPFYIDEITFNNSMKWWEQNYKEDKEYKKDKTSQELINNKNDKLYKEQYRLLSNGDEVKLPF